MVLRPCVTGVVLKWNAMVMFPFCKAKAFAAVPFTVKSVGWTVAGSTGSLTLTIKSVGAVPVITLPQAGLVTWQGMEVAVAVGVGVNVAVAVAVGVNVAVAVGVNVAVAVGLGVRVAVGVGDGLGVRVAVGDGVGLGVRVAVGDGVGLGVRVAVGVGVASSASPAPWLLVFVTEEIASGTCEKVFAGLISNPAAQNSAPRRAGIL